jgi:N-acetylglucosaminyldiphosphoundecaprenol N-acetyl-beta-D-mannosaminyltransferase
VLEAAIAELRRRHPSLQLAGSQHGYFKPERAEAVAEQIRIARPDCLFVGMPTPQKECFMAAYRAKTEVPLGRI